MKHWLYPFKDKIKDFKYTSTDITITIEATKEELTLNVDRDTMVGYGVKEISIETPVFERWINSYEKEMGHTGERFITLVIDRNKINQKLIEDYNSTGKLLV